MKVTKEAVLGRAAQTTGQQVLFLMAIGFVGVFTWWWYQAWSALTTPENLLSAAGVFTLIVALVYGIVEPLLISMLLPNSPTGMYLQRQTWRYPGQLAVLAAAIVLGYFGYAAMSAWLEARYSITAPEFIGSGSFYAMLWAAIVGAVLVPALQFAYQTPGQQMLVIQQAHEIKKLQILHDGEIAVLEGRMARAAILAAKEWSNLLPGEKDEIYGTLRGIFMGIADTQRRLARLQRIPIDVRRDLGIPDDQEVTAQVEQISTLLLEPAKSIERSIALQDDQHYDESGTPAHVDSRLEPSIPRAAPREAEHVAPAAHVDSRLQSLESRDTASDTGSQRLTLSDPVARRIAAELPRIFTAQNLADLVQQDKRTAQRTIAVWLQEGLIEQVQLGRYSLTKREAAR